MWRNWRASPAPAPARWNVLFKRETGLSFSEWRNRLRLMEAVNHLSHGKSSVEIAGLLGYRSASAFVAAFGRGFGVPPQSYLKVGSAEDG
ncbi:MAG: hypothetical protein CML23_12660 [Rhizobiaceae bacterium]|nr:hypothetical protein [Rhizobiaceae bacterium]